jgi:hypothetical protein
MDAIGSFEEPVGFDVKDQGSQASAGVMRKTVDHSAVDVAVDVGERELDGFVLGVRGNG